MRRYVNVLLSARVLDGLFITTMPGAWVRTNRGLPEDVTFVGSTFDWERQLVVVTYSHPTFAEVPDGQLVPEFRDFEMEAIYLNNPLTENDIKSLNALTARQAEEYERSTPAVVAGG